MLIILIECYRLLQVIKLLVLNGIIFVLLMNKAVSGVKNRNTICVRILVAHGNH
jgi:hypothetical protein